jgi:Na+/H+ antiporter NhaD/arsenite permease-like protein
VPTSALHVPPLYAALPFLGILLSIAILPASAPHFWHRHYHQVALAWAAAFAVPYLVARRAEAVHDLLHTAVGEYVPFIALVGSLFIIAGGIVVRGRLAGTPLHNTGLLAFGTLIASLIGTTGAAMVLIRPLLRANAWRSRRGHVVVFFIFLVANIGGSLTPLGDPPLFLGFLQGVPFFWTLKLLPHLGLAAAFLLLVFFVVDTWFLRRETASRPAPAEGEPHLGIDGGINLLLLAAVLGAVLLSGVWHPGTMTILGVEWEVESAGRDAILVALAGLSLRLTPERLRRANAFSWEPIREVAWLFAGIFVTLIPAIALLRGGEGPVATLLGRVTEPWQIYWATGLLSAVLDNAPTYLSFFNALLGRMAPGLPTAEGVRLLTTDGALHLEAVAAGAVFMGAMTYIGNAPNLMVRAIAQDAGVPMPSFGGFILRYTLPFLVPALILVQVVLF